MLPVAPTNVSIRARRTKLKPIYGLNKLVLENDFILQVGAFGRTLSIAM